MVSEFNLALIEITTRYWLDSPRIESRVVSGLGAHPASCKTGTESLLRAKAVEAWR
jgi:hypothetical protein